MFARHPKIAQRWAEHTKSIKKLPETADGLTEELDQNKGAPQSKPAIKELASYWDQWLVRQKALAARSEDLFTKLLLGQGDRPDIGAGIIQMGFGDTTAGGSGSSSGYATTVSNLSEIRKEKPKAMP